MGLGPPTSHTTSCKSRYKAAYLMNFPNYYKYKYYIINNKSLLII